MFPALNGPKFQFECKDFNALSIKELYHILQLRQDIFVVEQNCPYLDCDGKDLDSLHLCYYDKGELLAYARLIPEGISYTSYSSIGRVVCVKALRGTGLAKALMRTALDIMLNRFGAIPIKISAQLYIKKFYQDLGFKAVGEEYLEDDIPHQAMIYHFDS
ncbi:MAG: GNAT family N-acetyltransferase [Saprospiraceae bacterium]|jgi:ElaA protein